MSTYTRWIAFAAVVAVVPSTMVTGRDAQPAASAALCWRSLAPETGPQQPGLIPEPTLAVTASGEIWLSWQEKFAYARLLRWAAGQWTSPPAPSRAGYDGLWVTGVTASPLARVVVAAAVSPEYGAPELHIGRLIDGAWDWLGAPLFSSQAHRASVAFVGERPVVAWSEMRHAELADLFVALWDGSSWTHLGSLTAASSDRFVSPAVAVDANQNVWLAWDEAGGVRVARWDGSTWLDIGRDTLEKITAAQGPSLRAISLAVDTNGHAWVLRLAVKKPSHAGLALARWDGAGWTAVPAPRGPEEKDSTAWSAAMILRHDAPIVAWSQSDGTDNHNLYVTDNHHLYVSEWAAGDRWTARLSGLHLVEGASDVTDVRLAAGEGDEQTLFVSWDEPGKKDKRRTRLVRAYTCPAGETPAPPPTSAVEPYPWPRTVDEAARQIVGALDNESKARVRMINRDRRIQYRVEWGNSVGLWQGNEKLLESCGHGESVDPDECSWIITQSVFLRLWGSTPEAQAR